MSDILGGTQNAESAKALAADTDDQGSSNAEAIKAGLSFDNDPGTEGAIPFPGQELSPEPEPAPAAEPVTSVAPPEETPALPEETPAAPAADEGLAEKRQAVRQKFGLGDDVADTLVDAHVHLQKSFGLQTTELGELRRDYYKLDGKVDALTAMAPATPAKAAAGQATDEQAKTATWNAGVSHLAARHVQHGYSEEEARALASDALTAASHVILPEVDAKLRPILARDEAETRVNKLFDVARKLKDEVSAENIPIRPDWDQVINSPEFAALVNLEDPEIIDSLFTRDPAGELTPVGVESAYLKARFNMGDRLQAEAGELSSAAEDTVVTEKMRASAVSGAPSANAGEQVEDIEAEIFATAKGGNNGHFLMTGRLPE